MSEPATARERLAPYLGDIAQACSETGEDPFRLAGLILRESGAGWGTGYLPKGDPCGWGDEDAHGVRHGYGLCQLDSRWNGGFIGTPESQTPLGQFRRACSLLKDNRAWFHRAPVALAGDDLERAVFAAYNAGPGRVLHCLIAYQDPDHETTGGDYSRDIFRRSETLRGEFPDLFQVKP